MTTTLFIVAAIMALCGIYGYRKGFWPMLIGLAILLVALLAVRRGEETLVRYLNGIFIGAVLVLKSGLTDLSQGNLDAAKQKLASVQKPFSDEGEKWALVIMIALAVVLAILAGLPFKKKTSVWGLLLGLGYGYLLSAALLPVLLGFPEAALPLAPAGEAAAGPCAGLIGRFTCYLNQPGNAAFCGTLIVIGTALFVVLVVLRTVRGGKKGDSGGNSKKDSQIRSVSGGAAPSGGGRQGSSTRKAK